MVSNEVSRIEEIIARASKVSDPPDGVKGCWISIRASLPDRSPDRWNLSVAMDSGVRQSLGRFTASDAIREAREAMDQYDAYTGKDRDPIGSVNTTAERIERLEAAAAERIELASMTGNLQHELAKKGARLEEANARIGRFNVQVDDLIDKLRDARAVRDHLEVRRAGLEKDCVAAFDERDKLRETEKAITEQLGAVTSINEWLSGKVNEITAERDALTKHRDQLIEKNNQLRAHFGLEHVEDPITAEVKSLTVERDGLLAQLAEAKDATKDNANLWAVSFSAIHLNDHRNLVIDGHVAVISAPDRDSAIGKMTRINERVHLRSKGWIDHVVGAVMVSPVNVNLVDGIEETVIP